MYKTFIFLLLIIVNVYSDANTILLKEKCFDDNKHTINKWIYVSKQDQVNEITLPLQLIKKNIEEYNYSALMQIDKFKITNFNKESREKQIIYHANIIETFKGKKLSEIEFSKTIDIDEKICLDSTIVGHTLLINLEEYEKKYYGPDVGCVSSIADKDKNKLMKLFKISGEYN
ncbi:hypothetical protein [Sulfurimonas sp.]|uniref:hypothetical protein n=1 Tax=Sulfurimonas sp. TaxID=2022749 RepID=UPI0025ECF8EA|nr:hypothetical protein [Sulfurimonas sp.]